MVGSPTRAHVELVRAIVTAGDSRAVVKEKLQLTSRSGVSNLLRAQRCAGRSVAQCASTAYGVALDDWSTPATEEERARWLELLHQIPQSRDTTGASA